jgi:hypothetical protein
MNLICTTSGCNPVLESHSNKAVCNMKVDW